jgi:cytoskeletal protein RodZ
LGKISYDYLVLKKTRESKKLSLADIAHQLCLGERHVLSIEENRCDYFLSPGIKLVAIKKYAKVLNLDIWKVIDHVSES